MKLKLLLVFLLALQFSVIQAQNCKYLVNDQDPLTDDVIRTIRTRLTAPTPYYYFTYIRHGGDFKFKIEVADYGELINEIPSGSELILRAGNGEIFKMKAVDKAIPMAVKDFGSVLTRYEILYQTSEEAMRAIETSGIKFIRISDLQNSFRDQEFPPAVMEIAKANAICLFK